MTYAPFALFEQTPRVDLARGFYVVLQRGLDTLATWSARARERRQLADLDDRMLKDIGISRADADFEQRKPFWRA